MTVIRWFRVIQEWTFLILPATFIHWLEAAHGKWDLCTNVMMNFTAPQLVPLVICPSCHWRSRRHILMATTVYLLHKKNLLHTDLAADSYIVSVDLSSWGGIRGGRPVGWTISSLFAIGHGSTNNFFSAIPFPFFSTSAMLQQNFGRCCHFPDSVTQTFIPGDYESMIITHLRVGWLHMLIHTYNKEMEHQDRPR